MRPGANVFTLLPPGLNPKNAGRGEQTFVKSTFLSTSEKLSLRAKSTFTRLSCLILLWISFVPIPSTVTNAGSGTTVSRSSGMRAVWTYLIFEEFKARRAF